MGKRALLGVIIAAGAVGSPARAADKAACIAAASQGQKLRDAHDLIGAREQFRICASAGCPAIVEGDCAGWLDAVEKGLPTVVVAAKDRAGNSLVDVKVSMDGQPFLSRLEGRATAVNPGVHTFRFETATENPVDLPVLVNEGAKDQVVSVVLGPPAAQGATAGSPLPAGPTETTGSSSTMKTLGWVVGSVGLAGVVLGAVFGIVAMADKSSHCTGNVCSVGSTGGIKTDALVSNIGWIGGGLLVGTGVALLLLAPGGNTATKGGVSVTPTFAVGSAAVVLDGRW
jgi:hypothetical protein